MLVCLLCCCLHSAICKGARAPRGVGQVASYLGEVLNKLPGGRDLLNYFSKSPKSLNTNNAYCQRAASAISR